MIRKSKNRRIFMYQLQTEYVLTIEQFQKTKILPNKILLVLDNALSYTSFSDLQYGNIKCNLPKLKREVMECLQRRYRLRLLSLLPTSIDHRQKIVETHKHINVLQVKALVSQAWDHVTATTLSRSWGNLLARPTLKENEVVETTQ